MAFITFMKNIDIKKRIISYIRIVSYILLAWAAFNLSVDLFKGLASTKTDENLFIRIVVGLELAKNISLILSKSSFYLVKKLKEDYKHLFSGIGFFFLYILLALVTIFSGYGYIRTSVENTVFVESVAQNTDDILFYEKKIDELQIKIDGYIPSLSKENLSIVSKEKYERMIAEAQNQQNIYRENLNDLKSIKASQGKSTSSMYGLIASDMGVSEKSVRFWIQILTIIVIELCAVVMAPGLHVNVYKSSDPEPKKEGTKESSNAIWNSSTVSSYETPKKRKYNRKKPVSEIKRKPRRSKTQVTPESKDIQETPPETESVSNEVSEVIFSNVNGEVQEEKDNIPVKETAFERFVHALFDNGEKTSLVNKNEASVKANVPTYKANEFFTALTKTKGTTGFSLIEYRKDGFWYPNYTEQVIISMFLNGKIIS